MGIRLRRRDGSCVETGTRGNGEVIEDLDEEVPITTYRGGRGRAHGRRGGRGGRGRRGGRG